MAVYFVKTTAIVATPSDSNDGLDPIGFNLSGATYDDTGNGEGEHHLSSTGAFSSYTHQAGDLIYLSGGAGITAGLYEIASKVDADAILLTESAGSDSTGDVTSSSGPFLTIDYAINEGGTGNTSLATGDEIRICNDANYTNVALAMDTTGGDGSTYIDIGGYNSRGNTSEQVRLISGGNTVLNQTVSYVRWRNIWFDGDSRDINSPQATVVRIDKGTALIGCKISDAEASAVDLGGLGSALVNCEITGIERSPIVNIADGTLVMGCKIHNNSINYASSIVECGSSHGTQIVGNTIYNNTGGINYLAVIEINRDSSEGVLVMGNTIYSNDGDGIYITNENASDHSRPHILNNTICNNGGYGIYSEGNVPDVCENNHLYLNTSGHTNLGTGQLSDLPGKNNITGDPLFADPANGDFTPGAGSPLLNAAVDVTDL